VADDEVSGDEYRARPPAHEAAFLTAPGGRDYELPVSAPSHDYGRNHGRNHSGVVGVSKQINSNPSRVSFNPGGVDIEVLDEVAADRDMSRAELIRQTLQEVVEEYDDGADHADLNKPEHPDLREAFEALLDASDHPRGVRRVTVEEARSTLHTQNTKKSQVSSRLLRPLDREGFITVRGGYITVHRRTVAEVEEARQQTEEEVEQLGYDGPLPSQDDIPEEQKTIQKYQHGRINVPFGAAAWATAKAVWDDDGGASV
jgi:hypothetical protein